MSFLVFALSAAADDPDPNPQDCNVQLTWHFDDDAATVVVDCSKSPKTEEEEEAEDGSRASGPSGPWAAESPRAAGAAYGVGVGYLSQWQTGLENVAVETTTTTRGPDGEVTTTELPGDPDLNNRKFDFDFRLFGPIFQVPLALPELSLGSSTVYPSVVLEIGAASVDLQLQDRSEPDVDNSLDGDAPLVGLWFDVIARLRRDRPWLVGGGFRSRFLPETGVDRHPGFAEPGFERIEDEVRLQWESHQAYARFGYDFGRIAPYVGVRRQETRIEVDDHLRFAGDLDQTLDTQTEFQHDSTAPLLGFDAHWTERFFGRVEAVLGNDATLLVKVTYLPGARTHPTPDGEGEDPDCNERTEPCWGILLGWPDDEKPTEVGEGEPPGAAAP